MEFVLKYVILDKISKQIIVVGIFVRLTLSIVHHVELHVDFHPLIILWAFRPSPLCVK